MIEGSLFCPCCLASKSMLCIPTDETMHCVLYRATWCNHVERHAELAYMRYAMLFLIQDGGLGWTRLTCLLRHSLVSHRMVMCLVIWNHVSADLSCDENSGGKVKYILYIMCVCVWHAHVNWRVSDAGSGYAIDVRDEHDMCKCRVACATQVLMLCTCETWSRGV